METYALLEKAGIVMILLMGIVALWKTLETRTSAYLQVAQEQIKTQAAMQEAMAAVQQGLSTLTETSRVEKAQQQLDHGAILMELKDIRDHLPRRTGNGGPTQ